MPGRRFARSIVTVERASKSNVSGTLQPVVTYAAVSGLTGIEAAVIHSSSAKIPTDLGILAAHGYIVNFETERLPAGADLRPGDRIKVEATGETFTIAEAKLVEDRYWACTAERKQA